MTQEKPAVGVTGFLLYSPVTQTHFFRVYNAADENGRKTYSDYKLCAEDIEITIVDKFISLHKDENPRLDYASWYGPASGQFSLQPDKPEV